MMEQPEGHVCRRALRAITNVPPSKLRGGRRRYKLGIGLLCFTSASCACAAISAAHGALATLAVAECCKSPNIHCDTEAPVT
jgi:hypothetical protein